MPEVSHFQFSRFPSCSSPMARTLAVTSRQLSLTLPFAASSSVNFNGRLSSSLSPAASTPLDQSAKFLEAFKKGGLIPLYHCILCDHLIPVLAYCCLVNEDDRDAPIFLFELVELGLDASTICYRSSTKYRNCG
ncbi:hypothetical protein P3X46_029011 [Hevea brasiliensis]|uniref:Uncharacterized protein n=1 Tax=Hevea brasiliensis TaxID=3981 RepID=A0ABQ9KRR6_HEVBR|nr:hypothetical protein P3X46_029011 [Hevea brasiliensis]